MSLLMDELKKAERAQRNPAADLEPDATMQLQADTRISAPAQPQTQPQPQPQTQTQTQVQVQVQALPQPRKPGVPIGLSAPIKSLPKVFVRWMHVASVRPAAGRVWGGLVSVPGAMGRTIKACFVPCRSHVAGVWSLLRSSTLAKAGAEKRWSGYVVATVGTLGALVAVWLWAPHGKQADLPSSQHELRQPVGAGSAMSSPPSLQRAEAAFKAGRMEQARAEYQQLLSVQPDHLEALRGLAKISQQAGQYDVAYGYYQHILRIAPQDVQAQIAGAGVQSQRDFPGAESRLKTLISSQPRLASAHFALGNLYASQSRWREAQTAFLQAYRNEPDNPDMLYSLAISYDHLQQVRQALMFYRLAQQTAGVHPASFDSSHMNTRIATLTALLEP